jgi:hypothetical protein
LVRAERRQKNTKLILKIVLHANGGMLQIGRFEQIALAGHRAGFEIAVKNHAFGEVAVGRFIVSFQWGFLA